jgi:eukaryotic-like serine/threonine-protein kinase
MGDIYVARDRELSRQVAVKMLIDRFATDTNLRERFKREATAAARLSGHPHIVTIFDVGETDDRPFIVMEYLSGGTLGERLDGPRAPNGQVFDWLEQTADALDAAHAEGIVHRDVKPANLLFDDRDRLRVADFGIARVVDDTLGLTLTGTILGTAGYISPEQARGQPATSASDVYSLAVVAYELLTGSRPFERETATAEAAAHAYEPVPLATERNPRLPTGVNQVFERALAKDSDERHESAGRFVADLRDAVAPREAPTRVLATPAPAPAVERSRRLVLLALAALLLAAGGVAAAVFTAGNDGGPDVRTLVRRQTVTTAGKPVIRRVTVTQTAVATPPPPAAPTSPAAGASASAAGASASGSELNLQGYELQQQGRYSEALPLLQQAVAKLAGTYRDDFRDEAYATFNLGYTLLQLGRCDEALTYLSRSEQLQGHRDEIDAAQAQAETCLGTGKPAKGTGKGRGREKGNGNGDEGD